jgi:molecular chaperone GrpE
VDPSRAETLSAESELTGALPGETPVETAAAPEASSGPEATIPLEQHQRLLAEFDNYRKRLERERERLTRSAQGDLMRNLLPVLDDLERAEPALQAPDEEKIDRAAMLKIVRLLAEGLRREGLVRIDAPPGTVFDPNEHEAVLTIPTAEMPEGSVVEALQAGYRLGDRLLRPARVVVARAPVPPPEDPGPDAG